MNKNTVKKLAENPHYSMNEKELDALSQLLREEADNEIIEEEKVFRRVNKNRVKANHDKLDKENGIEEEDDVTLR